MSIETEKKFQLNEEEFKRLEEMLEEFGAAFIGEDFEVNELYSGGILTDDNALLRVRKVNDKTILTYKRKLFSNLGVKQHTEYETEVTDAEAIEKL